MIVNTEPAERDEVSVSSDGAEVLADPSVGVDCWSSVEVTVGGVVSDPGTGVDDVSSDGGVELVWSGLEVEGWSSTGFVLEAGVDGATGVETVTLLTARFAKLTMLAASGGSSRCIASAAMRSSINIPCLNFFGEYS